MRKAWALSKLTVSRTLLAWPGWGQFITGLVVASLICLLDLQAQSEELAPGMSRDKVAITSTFDGSDILLSSAVKRETEIPEGTMHVIATISEPLPPGRVLRKERTCGI